MGYGEGLNMKKEEALMSLRNIKNPSGGVNPERVIKSAESDINLMERIFCTENVRSAWKQVKSNKGKPGIDGITIDAFPELMHSMWAVTLLSLFDGTYQPDPVRRVEIPKATGGLRPLGIPTVLDRVIQQSVARVLGSMIDPKFSDSSYGFRPKRSAHQAVHRVRGYIVEGYRTAVDVDLRQFFDRVDHDVLMRCVGKHVQDKRVLALIGKYLRAGVWKGGRLHQTRMGVPQGGPLSPLLANILLDDLDKELEKRGHRFVRYADDFIIMVKSQRAGERVMGSIQRFLERKLKLQINEDKSRVVPANRCSFLGFIFKGKKIRWSDKAFQAFKRRIRVLTGRSWFVSMKVRFYKLAQYLRGWMNYYGISEYYRPMPELDHWLRRRVRMCYWKQWRYCRTKVRNLRKLGTPLRAAISVGLSRKGPWHLSRTLATNSGMSNQWLKDQGLISIKQLWVNIHYPATAR